MFTFHYLIFYQKLSCYFFARRSYDGCAMGSILLFLYSHLISSVKLAISCDSNLTGKIDGWSKAFQIFKVGKLSVVYINKIALKSKEKKYNSVPK